MRTGTLFARERKPKKQSQNGKSETKPSQTKPLPGGASPQVMAFPAHPYGKSLATGQPPLYPEAKLSCSFTSCLDGLLISRVSSPHPPPPFVFFFSSAWWCSNVPQRSMVSLSVELLLQLCKLWRAKLCVWISAVCHWKQTFRHLLKWINTKHPGPQEVIGDV